MAIRRTKRGFILTDEHAHDYVRMAVEDGSKPSSRPIACADRMPPEREQVLMWEVPSLRWSVGSWAPEYQQWSNRDDPEYAIHPDQVSHWTPLPKPITS